MDVEFIVVGSGPVGVSAARRYAEAGHRVLLFEQGEVITEPAGSHLFNESGSRDDPDSYMGKAFERLDDVNPNVGASALPGAGTSALYGGQGNLWFNASPRLEACERWPAISDSEWERYYASAEAMLRVSNKQFNESVRQRLVLDKLKSEEWLNQRPVQAQPTASRVNRPQDVHYTAPVDILADMTGIDRERISIKQAKVERIEHDGEVVSGVLVDGEIVSCKHLIVAGGAIFTPRLLHCSDIRPASLGTHVHFHPLICAQVVLDDGLYSSLPNADTPARLQIAVTGTHQWHTLISRLGNLLQAVEPDLDVADNQVLEIAIFCPVEARKENTMQFDGNGKPVFDVKMTQNDQNIIKAALQDAHDIGASLGRLKTPASLTWSSQSKGFHSHAHNCAQNYSLGFLRY